MIIIKGRVMSIFKVERGRMYLRIDMGFIDYELFFLFLFLVMVICVFILLFFVKGYIYFLCFFVCV